MDAVNKTNGTIASERTVWVSFKLLTKTLRPKHENASNPHFCNTYERSFFRPDSSMILSFLSQ